MTMASEVEVTSEAEETVSRDRWSKKSRSQYACARREKLVALLCARDYEALVGGALAIGEVPMVEPGRGYGLCAKCRSYLSFDRLEIDHVDGSSWSKRSVSAWMRVARYWREFPRRREVARTVPRLQRRAPQQPEACVMTPRERTPLENRTDATWLRDQIEDLADHAVLMSGTFTPEELRAHLGSIASGASWRLSAARRRSSR